MANEFPRANLPSAAVDPDSLARHESNTNPHPGIFIKVKDNDLGLQYITIFVTHSEFREIPKVAGFKYNPTLVWYVGVNATDPITGLTYTHMHPYVYSGRTKTVDGVTYPIWDDKIEDITIGTGGLAELLEKHITDTDELHPNFHPTLARKKHTHVCSDITDLSVGSGNITFVKGSTSQVVNVNQNTDTQIDLGGGGELPIRTVILWYGPSSEMGPSGSMKDWRTCDGKTYTITNRITNSTISITTPNTIGRYVMGATNGLGTEIRAGLPNIIGSAAGSRGFVDRASGALIRGASINLIGADKNYAIDQYAMEFNAASGAVYASNVTSGGAVVSSAGRRMSTDDNPYGKSNTVTPPTITGRYVMKIQNDDWIIDGNTTPVYVEDIEITSTVTRDFNEKLTGYYFNQNESQVSSNLSWFIASGELPAGLNLTSNGRLSGNISATAWSYNPYIISVKCVKKSDEDPSQDDPNYTSGEGTVYLKVNNKYATYSAASRTVSQNNTSVLSKRYSAICSNINGYAYVSSGYSIGSLVIDNLPPGASTIMSSSLTSSTIVLIATVSAKASTYSAGYYRLQMSATGGDHIGSNRLVDSAVWEMLIGPYFLSDIAPLSVSVPYGQATSIVYSDFIMATNKSTVSCTSVDNLPTGVTRSNTSLIIANTVAPGEYTLGLHMSAANASSSTFDFTLVIESDHIECNDPVIVEGTVNADIQDTMGAYATNGSTVTATPISSEYNQDGLEWKIAVDENMSVYASANTVGTYTLPDVVLNAVGCSTISATISAVIS